MNTMVQLSVSTPTANLTTTMESITDRRTDDSMLLIADDRTV